MLKGKKLSILGDSISTYKGVSDDAGANATLFYNPCFYRPPLPEEKTYWRLLMDTFSLSLCVNNSYSGGNLSGKTDPASGLSRAGQLSRDDGTEPDLIIVFMGLNDLGRGFDADFFASDYRQTLLILKESYPRAAAVCVTLPDRDPVLRARTLLFNEGIESAVREMGKGFFTADLFHSPLNNDTYYNNTLDGLHPDEDGMRMIAEVIEGAIRENLFKSE